VLLGFTAEEKWSKLGRFTNYKKKMLFLPILESQIKDFRIPRIHSILFSGGIG